MWLPKQHPSPRIEFQGLGGEGLFPTSTSFPPQLAQTEPKEVDGAMLSLPSLHGPRAAQVDPGGGPLTEDPRRLVLEPTRNRGGKGGAVISLTSGKF